MHAYMMTRGILHDSENFIRELSMQKLPFEFDKDGKHYNMVQLSVRPIQLWEVVFPEHLYDVVMNTLFDGTLDGIPPEMRKFHLVKYAIRKALHIDEATPYKTDQKIPLIFQNNVQRMCLGVKKDRYEGTNEML